MRTKMLWVVPVETGSQLKDLWGDKEKQAYSN